MENFLTTTNLFFPLLGILSLLIGVIWNSTGKRLDEMHKKLCALENFDADMAEIKTDIKWIKGYLFDIKKK